MAPAMPSAASACAWPMPSAVAPAWRPAGTRATIAVNSRCRWPGRGPGDERRARGCGHEGGRLKVVIVDDEPLARARLRELLGEQAGVTVVAEAADGHAALHACA